MGPKFSNSQPYPKFGPIGQTCTEYISMEYPHTKISTDRAQLTKLLTQWAQSINVHPPNTIGSKPLFAGGLGGHEIYTLGTSNTLNLHSLQATCQYMHPQGDLRTKNIYPPSPAYPKYSSIESDGPNVWEHEIYTHGASKFAIAISHTPIYAPTRRHVGQK